VPKVETGRIVPMAKIGRVELASEMSKFGSKADKGRDGMPKLKVETD